MSASGGEKKNKQGTELCGSQASKETRAPCARNAASLQHCIKKQELSLLVPGQLPGIGPRLLLPPPLVMILVVHHRRFDE